MMNQDYFALAVKLAFADTRIVKDMREMALDLGITGHLQAVAACSVDAPCEACQQHLASALAELTGPDQSVKFSPTSAHSHVGPIGTKSV